MPRESMDKKNAQFSVQGADELIQQALEAVERVGKNHPEDDDHQDVLDADLASSAPVEASAAATKSSTNSAEQANLDESDDVTITFEEPIEEDSQPSAYVAELTAQLEQAQAQVSQLQSQVEQLEETLRRSEQSKQDVEQDRQQHYERLLRLSADFDNLRKRSTREKEEMKKFGSENVMRDLLNVLDNFERALDSMGDASPSVREGVEMVYRQLLDTMTKNGVKRFSCKGEPFDYTLHEAISVVESAEMPANFVMEEFQPGYMFHDRLLRAARVVVSKAPSQPVADPGATMETAAQAESEPDFPPAEESSTLSDTAAPTENDLNLGFSPNDVMDEEVIPSGEYQDSSKEQ